MKTTLAIPNYNGAQNIEAIIPRVFEENFDAIYVLDDCSDDNSLELLKPFESKVNVVRGQKNIGAGGNRNRIIDYVKDGIIMFLDVGSKVSSPKNGRFGCDYAEHQL